MRFGDDDRAWVFVCELCPATSQTTSLGSPNPTVPFPCSFPLSCPSIKTHRLEGTDLRAQGGTYVHSRHSGSVHGNLCCCYSDGNETGWAEKEDLFFPRSVSTFASEKSSWSCFIFLLTSFCNEMEGKVAARCPDWKLRNSRPLLRALGDH